MENTNQEQAKVLNFPQKPVIFSDEMKRTLAAGIEGKTKSDEIVNEIEKLICRQIVLMARNVGNVIGKKIAEFITGQADKVLEPQANQRR